MAKRRGAAGGVAEWARQQSKRPSKAAWRSWPAAAVAEVLEVLRLCDAGEASVSMPAMIGRLRDAHGVQATRNMLDKLVWAHGRRSWTKP